MSNIRPLVLIADDDPDLRELIHLQLEESDYSLIEANNGERTLEMVLEKSPDAIILDVMMPGLSGWEILKYIRQHKLPIGVIMLTGIGKNLNAMSSDIYGADAYIDKPFKAHELQFKLREVLAKYFDTPCAPHDH